MFNIGNILSLLPMFRSNPMGILQQYGFNVPQGTTAPNAIIQHLLNSGQISQQQYEQARQVAQQFGFR